MINMRDSQWSYDPKEIEKKSELFLKTVIGNDNFDKLQKDGKIEIEINNKSNEKTIYELYSDGRVINKTKNQSYCIVADRSDYPTNDMVAIKYAWIVHKNEIAEKVANRTNLHTRTRVNRSGLSTERLSTGYDAFVADMERRGWNRQSLVIDGSPYYGDYVDYLSEKGWTRRLITINELNTDLINIRDLRKGSTGCIIDIKCSDDQKIAMMGKMQTPRGVNPNSAYSMGLYITDENGEEIPDDTKIRITKEKDSDAIIQLARIFYSDIKRKNGQKGSYSFQHGIELNYGQHLMVFVVNPGRNIPKENIKFEMEIDLWNRNT